MGRKLSDRLRNVFKSVKIRVCGCHRNKDTLVSMGTTKKPLKRNSTKDHFDVVISADEKLRSLGHKGQSKPSSSSTYCGSQTTFHDSFPPTSTSRPGPPSVPPPPLPTSTTNDISTNQSYDQQHQFESANHHPPSVIPPNQSPLLEEAPPIFPKPNLSQMAERRIQRQNNKDELNNGSDHLNDKGLASKRRSKSEGPHGRRRKRNSMHETSSSKQSSKHTSNGRYSMYAQPLSDEEIVVMHSGSDSADSDGIEQKWTKNPLMVRKSRKSNRISKSEKRKSLHNVENGFEQENGKSNQSRNSGRELYIVPNKSSENASSTSHKSKYQRMEANRKKRIDMAVTSDEECSPQLRISQLRQRAIISSKMFGENDARDDIDIMPNRGEHSNGYLIHDKSAKNRLSQYDENRLSKYDENFNIDNSIGKSYNENMRKQGVKHNKLPNILPEFLPVMRSGNVVPVQREPPGVSYQGHQANIMNKASVNQNQNRANVVIHHQKGNQNSQNTPTRVKLSSESPKLRNFNEVKTNQPTPLKKAVEKIELISRSPNSSSDDSLDELIESNIQYLESEIESGKLKRQSGNFSQYVPDTGVQRQVIREPLRHNVSARDDIRSRLHGPVKPMTTPTNYVQQRSNSYTPLTTNTYTSMVTNSRQNNTQKVDHRNMTSGSATYSPYMKRKTTQEYNEDLSKSDSQLNAPNAGFRPMQAYAPAEKSVAPYPVLNQQYIMYIQPEFGSHQQHSLSLPSVDNGMFSDVEYNIEVSDRIKKWEKKLAPGEVEEQRMVLNTIKEYESFSDSNEKSVPDTPLEIRRELRELLSPSDNSGVGRLSVNLTKSTSSISDSKMHDPSSLIYFEPKVVSSETNLHRIFRVVQEPKSQSVVKSAERMVSSDAGNMNIVPVQSRRKKSSDADSYHTREAKHAQSMSNMVMSESEIGSNPQQSWPPMVVDSDSGIRKSWRMSRYEEEINELKEIVSDNFRDLRKKFDSDVSETDTKRGSSPVRIIPQNLPAPQKTEKNTPITLNIQPITPTNFRSPVAVRRKLSDPQQQQTPPMSPSCPPLTPKMEKKLPIFRNIPVETKPAPPQPKAGSAPAPEVWSPNMESCKGLISIERVKPRTLQTIPFSEDPVWKEIEGLNTYERSEEPSKNVNFDDIDELLKLATGGMDRMKSFKTSNLNSDNLMTSSMSQVCMMDMAHRLDVPQDRHRKMSDSAIVSSKHSFTPPAIQPLKLGVNPSQKSSASALDDVLEDIRASLQKKPLSPKLLKNLDTSESNSSTNLSLQSPLSKSKKSFVFPKEEKKPQNELKPAVEPVKVSTATPGYDNAQSSWQQNQTTMPPQIAKQIADIPYIDPEFTQFPYIINGNYHLDPTVLSEKLQRTGLVHESSDEQSTYQMARNKAVSDLPANHRPLNNYPTQNHIAADKTPDLNSQPSQSIDSVQELDQSVDDLKSLALEVEQKLSKIKSKIVTADEDRLDNILLALRKFAPMTEQKFFNVKFTPNYETERARKSKLEDALVELEKMYESLDLEDENMMDRASRREEEISRRSNNQTSVTKVSSVGRVPITAQNYNQGAGPTYEGKILRRSQIDEIERQTQNEFEDITKSFQVLLDEVTKQCKNVAQGSSKYRNGASVPFVSPQVSQFSTRPADEIRQEPPRPQLKFENQSQRSVQDSYNTAIKELESVAMGTVGSSGTKSVQSSVYLNLDTSKPENQKINQNVKNAAKVSSSQIRDIQLQSQPVASNRNQPNVAKTTASNQCVSMATEFKPVMATSTSLLRETSSSDNQEDSQNKFTSNKTETSSSKLATRGAGRFRKRGNIEHRKSMPAITRTVETQTVETQTESPPSVSEIKDKFDKNQNSSFTDIVNDSSPVPVKRKMSTGIAKIVDMFSSSEDERGRDSSLRHSLSAPDLLALIDGSGEAVKKKSITVDKSSTKSSAEKGATPRSVKHRSEAKSRFRSLQKDDVSLKQLDILKATTPVMTSSMTSEEGVQTPTSKPPVYPVWKYPGQMDSPSPKKIDKKQAFGFDRDFSKCAPDGEREKINPREVTQVLLNDSQVIRRRTRSVGSDHEDEDRPKSFHELVATFEHNPQRIEKIRTSGLRKCASEDSMFTDLVLQKIYYSESDLSEDFTRMKKSNSGSSLKLALEMKVKN